MTDLGAMTSALQKNETIATKQEVAARKHEDRLNHRLWSDNLAHLLQDTKSGSMSICNMILTHIPFGPSMIAC